MKKCIVDKNDKYVSRILISETCIRQLSAAIGHVGLVPLVQSLASSVFEAVSNYAYGKDSNSNPDSQQHKAGQSVFRFVC